jgi:poly(hydroxyalkanoate) depolymerase family esterase
MILRVRDTIRRALASTGLWGRRGAGRIQAHAPADAGVSRPATALDPVVRDPVDRDPVDRDPVDTEERGDDVAAKPGQFVSRSYSCAAGTRSYKLYTPGAGADAQRALIVMLHGCRQNPDDFAAGTRMNEFADRHGFLVIYPAQAAAANGAKCWNWFTESNQQHGRGEPAIISGITRQVAAEFAVDPRRIYVAGLSAGGAMAVILGTTDPDLFAAVGVHSGLRCGAARDAASAFAAMKSGCAPGRPSTPADAAAVCKPTIVFHGDDDQTVNPINGEQVVEQALLPAGGREGKLQTTIESRAAVNGRGYTVTTYRIHGAPPSVEYWVLHGGGHAWSGGSKNGSFTDESGPDASAEMVRFFREHPAVHPPID